VSREESTISLTGRNMRNISLRILLAIVLTLTCVLLSSGYAGGDRPKGHGVLIAEQSEEAVPDQNFKIKYGQELTVKGEDLKIKFDSLLDDSRCPTDVKCVWEGDAKILISVRRARAKESHLELHTNQNFTRAGKYQKYTIKLIALDPYPRTRFQGKQSEYVATLLIKKQ
jgi:hypothetical protein